MEEKIELADVISQLRTELFQAGEKGKDHSLKFIVDEAEVELSVAVAKEGSGKASVKFWVYNAEAGGSISGATTQRVKLKLRPATVDDGELKRTVVKAKE